MEEPEIVIETVKIKSRLMVSKWLSLAFSDNGIKFVFYGGDIHAPRPLKNFKYRMVCTREEHPEYGFQLYVKSFEKIESKPKRRAVTSSRKQISGMYLSSLSHFRTI